jgi:putative ABC transport system permease protein
MKFALRQLLKSPGFTAVAVLTLALGVGTNTAIFGVLYRVVLNPLPFPHAGRLVRVTTRQHGPDEDARALTTSEFEEIGVDGDVLESVGAFTDEIRNLSGVGTPLRAWGARVTLDLLPTLGVAPVVGRLFVTDDYVQGGSQVVILNHALWQERFGGRPDIVGASVVLDGVRRVVCGVMPSSFRFPDKLTTYWTPLVPMGDEINDPTYRFLSVIARLRPGVSPEQWETRLQSVSRSLRETGGVEGSAESRSVATSLREEQLGGTGRVLWILFAAVSCATLIGAANLINLYFTRLTLRREELAVRMALGAGAWRIVRQWLTEALLQATLAGIVGLFLASWCIDLLRTYAPYGLPRAEEIAIDPVVVGFGFVLSLMVGTGAAALPVIGLLARPASDNALFRTRDGGRSWTHRSRSVLVMVQAAAATTLLIAAGLLLTSLRVMARIDPGFDAKQLLTARVVLSEGLYDNGESRRTFYKQLTDRVAALPDIVQVGMVNSLPLSEIDFRRPIRIEHQGSARDDDDAMRAEYTSVSANYFQLMSIPIRVGRAFEPSDEAGSPVVVISETMARRYFPTGTAVGRRIQIGPGRGQPWMTIVGVSGDVKSAGPDQPSDPRFYVPYLQDRLPPYTLRGMFLIAQTRVPPDRVVPRLREELNALDPTLALANIETMDARLAESAAPRRYDATLMGAFAGLAWVLAATGVFGVLSCLVADRRREIGVRIALGSTRAGLFRLVVRQGLKPVVLGIAAGWTLAWTLRGVTAGLLFGVSPHDPRTFLLVGALCIATATLACLVPAYRAAGLDPMEALRHD